jgi:carbamoyl-phosphate synthase large subunit
VPLTILRTAAGSAPSVTQYKVFRELGLRVIAADSDPLSVGFLFADAAYQVPLVSSPRYFDALVEICRRERVDWILPALDEELLTLAGRCTELEACGARLLSSPVPCLETCVDKCATHAFFRQHGIPTPATWEPDSKPLAGFPVIVKPRRGRGSTGIYIARDTNQLDFFSGYVRDAIVQEFMTGRELTVDILTDFASNPLFIRPRYRLKTESGISYKGAVVDHPGIVCWVEKIVRTLGLIGPANIQCFVDESDGIWFTEINARLAGSVALTFEADPAFACALVSILNGGSPGPAVAPAKPLIMLRYWSEVYLDPSKADTICTRL